MATAKAKHDFQVFELHIILQAINNSSIQGKDAPVIANLLGKIDLLIKEKTPEAEEK